MAEQTVRDLQQELDLVKSDLQKWHKFATEHGGQVAAHSKQVGQLQGELQQKTREQDAMSANNATLTSQLDEVQKSNAELEANAERLDSLSKVILQQRREAIDLLAKANERSQAELTRRYGPGSV